MSALGKLAVTRKRMLGGVHGIESRPLGRRCQLPDRPRRQKLVGIVDQTGRDLVGEPHAPPLFGALNRRS
jgi:hypothetical protein